MSKIHKKNCRVLKYFEHLLILVFTASECILVSAFTSLFGISIGITSSAISKSQYNGTEVSISKALTDSNITHDEFVLINNVMKKFYISFYDIKEKMRNSNDK